MAKWINFSVVWLLVKFVLMMKVAESFSLAPPTATQAVSSLSTARMSKESTRTTKDRFLDEMPKQNVGSISRKRSEDLWLSQPLSKAIRAFLAAATLMVLSSCTHPPLPALAAEGSRVVGEISGSGLVFKDTLRVESFDDPKVKGVTLYLTNFERPLTERLQKDFFSDPSASSLTCVRSGPLSIADNIGTGTSGEVSFSYNIILFVTSVASSSAYL
jgi:catabolite regulation protein CreA